MRSQLDTQERSESRQSEPELFEWAQAPLRVQTVPAKRQKVELYLLEFGAHRIEALPSPRPYATNFLVAFLDCQLTLPFAASKRPNVLRVVPRHGRAYLDYGVYDCFHDVRGAAKAALRLEAIGVLLIGQLIQRSEEQMRALPFMTEESLQAMREELAIFGLGFGARVPWWNRRFNFPAACAG